VRTDFNAVPKASSRARGLRQSRMVTGPPYEGKSNIKFRVFHGSPCTISTSSQADHDHSVARSSCSVSRGHEKITRMYSGENGGTNPKCAITVRSFGDVPCRDTMDISTCHSLNHQSRSHDALLNKYSRPCKCRIPSFRRTFHFPLPPPFLTLSCCATMKLSHSPSEPSD
jgi:hypothetical protein